MSKMWGMALAIQNEIPEVVPPNPAFPYVPISPEDFGLELSAGSLVLDVGCLGGYGLFDFYSRRLAAGLPMPRLTGIDIDPISVEFGKELARIWAGNVPVTFYRTSCEAMCLESGSVDMLLARGVLPYVDTEVALSEFARVVRPGGLSLLQVHAAGYYIQKLMCNIMKSPRSASYYARPLLSQAYFRLTGRQPQNRWFRETPLDMESLVAHGRRHGFNMVWSRPSPAFPMALFRRV